MIALCKGRTRIFIPKRPNIKFLKFLQGPIYTMHKHKDIEIMGTYPVNSPRLSLALCTTNMSLIQIYLILFCNLHLIKILGNQN